MKDTKHIKDTESFGVGAHVIIAAGALPPRVITAKRFGAGCYAAIIYRQRNAKEILKSPLSSPRKGCMARVKPAPYRVNAFDIPIEGEKEMPLLLP